MDLSPGQIAADGPFSTLTDRSTYQATPAGPRANQLTEENAVYRLVFDAQLDPPDRLDLHPGAGCRQRDRAGRRRDRGPDRLREELDQGIPPNRRITVTHASA